ncbi:MAG: DUF1963 domain-containing protein, partial [Verrucomicrobia bacterium]|nr:DUF1963 domain-containing protein [Cytophagales bacterium]
MMTLPELPKISDFEIPKDAKECFQIGEYIFKLKKTKSFIAKLSREFYTEIKAQLPKPQAAITEQLLDDYDGKGLASFQFGCLGIHQNGVPTGEFMLEEDKSSNPYFYLRREGFHYTLSFYGKITFQDGWMAYNGYLKPSYSDEPIFHPVKIYIKLDNSKLDWRNYHFSSIAETEGVADDAVQYLSLGNIEKEEFPAQILKFKQLKSLTIIKPYLYQNNEVLPLKSIPDGIGELTRLETLQITNCLLTQLPESLGKLKKMQNLNVTYCQLQTLPDAVFKLPNLMYLFLGNNKIKQISEKIKLPKLQAISLENNQLQTLPQSLAQQPLLRSLRIHDNPFTLLPVAFNSVKGIEMSLEDKRRLLDFEYKGADGKGTIVWNNELFFTDKNSPMLKPVEEVIKKNKLTLYKADLLALAKKTIAFTITEDENYQTKGNNRFGGMPDLPENIAYPEFYSEYDKKSFKYEFIAQINCREIAPLQNYLPRTGLLYFFLKSLHFFGYDQDNSLAKIIYVAHDKQPLVSGKELNFSNEDYYEMIGEGCYQGLQVNTKEIISFPSFYAHRTNIHIFKGRAEVLGKALIADEKLDMNF